MNVFRLLPYVSRPVFSDGKPDAYKKTQQQQNKKNNNIVFWLENVLYFIHKEYKGKFLFYSCWKFSKASVQQFYRQVIS